MSPANWRPSSLCFRPSATGAAGMALGDAALPEDERSI